MDDEKGRITRIHQWKDKGLLFHTKGGKKSKKDQSSRGSADNPETGVSITAIQSRPGKYHKCTLAPESKTYGYLFIHAASNEQILSTKTQVVTPEKGKSQLLINISSK